MGCPTNIFIIFLFCCFSSGLSTNYRVIILTGFQETSSRVEIRLVGDDGRTSPHVLKPRDGKFESKNKFSINDRDVGKVNAVELYLHSGSWSVRKVIVVASGGIYVFLYHDMIKAGKWTTIASKCPHGFEKGANGACDDIDECKRNPCKGPLAKCQNTIGSYSCVCPRGYRVRYGVSCEDIDECTEVKPYVCDQKCENTPGSYRCYCRSGYRFDEGKCHDINECAQGSSNCDLSSTNCSNTIGSYRCICKPGHYQKNSNSCQKVKCNRPYIQGASYGVLSPSRCNTAENYYDDVCVLSCNQGYKLGDPKVNSLKCGADARWKGTPPRCKPVECPALSPLANGRLLPPTCTTGSSPFKEQCVLSCNNGYYLQGGSRLRKCQANKTWSGSQPTCNKVIQKPSIRCPLPIWVDLAPGQNTSSVSSKWKNPTYVGDTLTVSPSYANATYRYPAGKTKITWTASNSAGSVSCSIEITVNDKEPPKVTYCPKSFIGVLTNSTSAKATWKEPTFTDNVGVTKVTSTRKSGDVFKLGSYNVYYNGYDKEGNSATCKFVVIVKYLTCPLPPLGPLNGTKKCNEFNRVKYCQASCPVGKQIFNNPSPYSHWACKNGIWNPTTIIPDCVAATLNTNGSACTGNQVKMSIKTPTKTNVYCADCPTGTYSTTGTCMQCPVGQYQDEQGRVACKPCPKWASSNSGAANVKDCKLMCSPGQFSSDGLEPGCKWCPKGTYQDQKKSTDCKKCPNGTSTISIGSTQLLKCGVKPIITSLIAKPDTINEGQDTNISCIMSGVPTPSPRLVFKKSIPSAFLGKMKWEFIEDSNGKRKGIRLSIKGAKFENTGQYECKAENSFGKVLKEVTLTVKKVFGSQG